jgi:hypothetical protein
MNTIQSRTVFSLALCLYTFVFSVVGEQGKVVDLQSERLKSLGQKIQNGNWAEARDYAKSQMQSSEKQAVEKYVLDVANDVLNQPRSQLLSEYDFPYSDKNALKEVQVWVNGLLKSGPKSHPVLDNPHRCCSAWLAIVDLISTPAAWLPDEWI